MTIPAGPPRLYDGHPTRSRVQPSATAINQPARKPIIQPSPQHLDRPTVAEHHVAIAERSWMPDGYQFQHWHMLYSRSDIDLYRGTPQLSLRRMNENWSRGRLLRQVVEVRSDMLYTRGRLALAVARETPDPKLIHRAIADARALQRDGSAWSSALGTLLLASAASFDSPAEAIQLTLEAERQLAQCDMPLHVETMRIRRAQLQAGSEGQTRIADSLERVRAFGVRRPEHFVDMLAPFGVARLADLDHTRSAG